MDGNQTPKWISSGWTSTDTAQLAEADVLGWLRNKCAGDDFRGKRGAFAAKLVRKVVDRAKGRKGGPRPLRVWDLKNLDDSPERFAFTFVGDGLTLALAVADWWVTLLDGMSEGPVVLARKLYEQNFDETEVGYLVRLITGVQLSKIERIVFGEWAAEHDAKAALRQAKECEN